jgi:small-conductance mechanosensitive channel
MLALFVAAHVQLTTNPFFPNAGSTAAATPSPVPTPSPTPSLSFTGLGKNALDSFADQTNGVTCTRDDISVCGFVLRLTGHRRLGQVLEVILGTPLRVLLIVMLGVLLRRTLHRLIQRLAERVADGAAVNGWTSGRAFTRNWIRTRRTASPVSGPAAGTSPMLTTRRQARARTLASVLRSVTTAVIGAIVVLMVLQELDFSVGPLLASAGVVGVALGLGAQSLVRDVVAGMFMIIEDQYGVGDVIDVGSASGSVEAVGLRVTQLRDVNGTVWYVRNGEIMRVGNQSQGWSRAVLDVNVGYAEDLDEVEQKLLDTAAGLRADPKFSPFILEDAEVWGVEALTADGVVMRLVIKTQPLQQTPVARELRRRIKQRFDRDGIEMRPLPRTVLVEEEEADLRHPEDADFPLR